MNEMTTAEVADRLIKLCGAGKWDQAQKELYAERHCCIEPEGAPWPIAEGLDAIKKKGDHWAAMVAESHSFEKSDSIIGGAYFSVSMKNDTTCKGMGNITFEEICVNKVEPDDIVDERFFYPPMTPTS